MSELLEEPKAPARPNVLATSLAVIGFGLALAAQYLPWAHLDMKQASRLVADVDDPALAKVVDIPASSFDVAHMTIYMLTLGLGLAALATVLATTGQPRRIATGAGIGLLAGNLLALVGLNGIIEHVTTTNVMSLALDADMVSSGPGYYLAYAAVLVLAAALVLGAWTPSAALRTLHGDEPVEGGEPLELTVTPVPPTLQ
jgi:hypothetical protein